MKRWFRSIVILLVGVFSFWAGAVWVSGLAQPSDLRAHVIDRAELLSGKTKKTLEKILSDFELETTHEIFVATFSTLKDETAESFGSRLADEWKIGYKDLGNGAIFIIFKNEHQAWLEVGLGLDRRLPFFYRKELIDEKLAPYFRNRQYDAGTLLAVEEIIRKIDPLYRLPKEHETEYELPWKKIILTVFLISLLSVIFDVISYRIYRNEILEHPESAYHKRIGRYSFLEWWLIYGFLITTFEFLYYRLFIFWVNPQWTIASRGHHRMLPKGKTGQGRFWGNGISGRW